MHSVNLDLLRATATHHPDGSPKDPHAHHTADCEAQTRANRSALWRTRLARLRKALTARSAKPHKEPLREPRP
ncbi:MAG: hypothetical protein EAZ40_18005 [Rhodobacterales bacterium]|nr:MAG: hypothetical protein EAZ40_18005 [Rhodobacterales bacterium]